MENIKEFDGKGYREFYSMNDLVKTIARTMKVCSWGAHAWIKMSKYLLRFKVEAHRHKGHIYIAVNGADLFDVFLTTVQGRVVKEFKDVYIEDLITTIDDEIEKIPEYSR
jgi:hypothetical protein